MPWEKTYMNHQGFQPTYDLSNNSAGAYFLQIHLPSKTISLEVVLVK